MGFKGFKGSQSVVRGTRQWFICWLKLIVKFDFDSQGVGTTVLLFYPPSDYPLRYSPSRAPMLAMALIKSLGKWRWLIVWLTDELSGGPLTSSRSLALPVRVSMSLSAVYNWCWWLKAIGLESLIIELWRARLDPARENRKPVRANRNGFMARRDRRCHWKGRHDLKVASRDWTNYTPVLRLLGWWRASVSRSIG